MGATALMGLTALIGVTALMSMADRLGMGALVGMVCQLGGRVVSAAVVFAVRPKFVDFIIGFFLFLGQRGKGNQTGTVHARPYHEGAGVIIRKFIGLFGLLLVVQTITILKFSLQLRLYFNLGLFDLLGRRMEAFHRFCKK